MTKRKLLTITAGTIIGIAMITGIVAAYFGAKDEEPNLISVGEDIIEITETFEPPEQKDSPFKYRKLVEIENTGSVPCYVRARIEFSNSDVQSYASFSADRSDTPSDDTFYSADVKASEPYIEHLPDGWVYIREPGNDNPTEGYYYYTSSLKPEQATDALISWIKMNYNGAEIQPHEVYVYSESVQTINPDTGVAYADWKEAWIDFTRQNTSP